MFRTERKKKRVIKKLKTKNADVQKKRSSRKVRGVSPEAGRESMVGKICDLYLTDGATTFLPIANIVLL